jgi:hypothetical protein
VQNRASQSSEQTIRAARGMLGYEGRRHGRAC